jgi:hypothetical protein
LVKDSLFNCDTFNLIRLPPDKYKKESSGKLFHSILSISENGISINLNILNTANLVASILKAVLQIIKWINGKLRIKIEMIKEQVTKIDPRVIGISQNPFRTIKVIVGYKTVVIDFLNLILEECQYRFVQLSQELPLLSVV